MLYNDKYLIFPDKATQETYFKPDEENPVNLYPQLNWDVIGTIYEPGATEEDPPVPLEGWHVNICYRFDAEWPEALDAYEIQPPSAPYRYRPVMEYSPQRRANLSCSRAQLIIYLDMIDLYEDVQTWIDETEDLTIQALYHESARFLRQSAFADAFQAQFELSDLDMDRIFGRAAEVTE